MEAQRSIKSNHVKDLGSNCVKALNSPSSNLVKASEFLRSNAVKASSLNRVETLGSLKF